MLGQNFTSIVEVCLTRLDRGENLPDVLADFPAFQERLKPLLLVAMATRAMDVPLPKDSTRRSGRNQMLAEMDQMGSKGYLHQYVGFSRVQGWFRRLVNTLRAKTLINKAPSYRLTVVALSVVFVLGLFAVSASASNLPGGFLGSFSSDIQQALGVFDFDQEGTTGKLPPALIFSGNDLQFDGGRAAKVAFLMNLLEDQNQSSLGIGNQNKKQNQGSAGGSQSQTSSGASSGKTDGKADAPGQQDIGPGVSDSHPQNNPASAYAPGHQQDGSAAASAPGVQDGPATNYAPGQLKKLDREADEKDKDKDKDKGDKEK